MILKIKDIVTILTGLYAKPVPAGDAIYLQASLFDGQGDLPYDVRPNIIISASTRRHLLESGDVLLAAKGTNNFAVAYNPLLGPAIASSTFLIIRLKQESQQVIMAAYIVWYLNHPVTQSLLKSQAKGSSMPSISKKTLEELEIPVPSLDRQRQILHLQELRTREKQIVQRLDMLREQYLQKQLLTAAQQ